MSSYGLWLSAAGMKVIDHKQALLANNLANASTTGFKHDIAVVRQRAVESAHPGGMTFAHPVLDGLSGGANVQPSYQDFTQGRLERTGNPLDLAIQDEGFFAVSDGSVTRYTRDGEMTLDASGELVLASAGGQWKVLDDASDPIVIDRSRGEIHIAADGAIRQNGEFVARLALVEPEEKQGLRKVGENLFVLTRGEMSPAGGAIVSGARETSNFDATAGLTSMIEASRAYQLNATMIQLQDDATGQAISRVGRVVA